MNDWPLSLHQQLELLRSSVSSSTLRLLEAEIGKQLAGADITDSHVQLTATHVHVWLIKPEVHVEIEIELIEQEAQQWRRPYQ